MSRRCFSSKRVQTSNGSARGYIWSIKTILTNLARFQMSAALSHDMPHQCQRGSGVRTFFATRAAESSPLVNGVWLLDYLRVAGFSTSAFAKSTGMVSSSKLSIRSSVLNLILFSWISRTIRGKPLYLYGRFPLLCAKSQVQQKPNCHFEQREVLDSILSSRGRLFALAVAQGIGLSQLAL